MADGRFYSQPCAAFDPISIEDFLPKRKCLLSPEQRLTGLAVWRRVVNTEYTEEYIVEDSRCPREISDILELNCGAGLDGSATYRFIPRYAYSMDSNGERVVDESKVTSGTLQKVWKCYKNNVDPYPDWFKLKIDSGLWRNEAGTVPNSNPLTSALQEISLGKEKEYNN